MFRQNQIKTALRITLFCQYSVLYFLNKQPFCVHFVRGQTILPELLERIPDSVLKWAKKITGLASEPSGHLIIIQVDIFTQESGLCQGNHLCCMHRTKVRFQSRQKKNNKQTKNTTANPWTNCAGIRRKTGMVVRHSWRRHSTSFLLCQSSTHLKVRPVIRFFHNTKRYSGNGLLLSLKHCVAALWAINNCIGNSSCLRRPNCRSDPSVLQLFFSLYISDGYLKWKTKV